LILIMEIPVSIIDNDNKTSCFFGVVGRFIIFNDDVTFLNISILLVRL
jgi:hypothetical protein